MTTGTVQERFSFDAYGISVALASTFALRGSSQFAWDVRYAGYRYDVESGWSYARNRIQHQPSADRFVGERPFLVENLDKATFLEIFSS